MVEASSYMVIKNDFPECPYIIDNFRAWLSSVGAKNALNYQTMVQQSVLADEGALVGSLTGGVSSLLSASGNPTLQGGISAAMGIATSAISYQLGKESRETNLSAARQAMALDVHYAETHGASIGGSFGGGSVPWFSDLIGWRMQALAIKPEYARAIDEFFTRFGYKVNRYKVPETTSRRLFNFVKTVDCRITGDLPDNAVKVIEGAFNAGITLWHQPGKVGRYEEKNEANNG